MAKLNWCHCQGSVFCCAVCVLSFSCCLEAIKLCEKIESFGLFCFMTSVLRLSGNKKDAA